MKPVLSFMVLLFMAAQISVHAEIIEQSLLAYDDSTFEWFALADSSSKLAARFTPPVYPCSLV